MLFRGEEHVDRWCAEYGIERGAIVPLDQLWLLSGPWYADRFDEDWRPKTPETVRRLLSGAGLTGDFWST